MCNLNDLYYPDMICPHHGMILVSFWYHENYIIYIHDTNNNHLVSYNIYNIITYTTPSAINTIPMIPVYQTWAYMRACMRARARGKMGGKWYGITLMRGCAKTGIIGIIVRKSSKIWGKL